jgi:hypothetical protein
MLKRACRSNKVLCISQYCTQVVRTILQKMYSDGFRDFGVPLSMLPEVCFWVPKVCGKTWLGDWASRVFFPLASPRRPSRTQNRLWTGCSFVSRCKLTYGQTGGAGSWGQSGNERVSVAPASTENTYPYPQVAQRSQPCVFLHPLILLFQKTGLGQGTRWQGKARGRKTGRVFFPTSDFGPLEFPPLTHGSHVL